MNLKNRYGDRLRFLKFLGAFCPFFKCPTNQTREASIDLVIEGGQKNMAVECEGDEFHSSSEQRENDMQRQRILERCGWTFWCMRGSEFYSNIEQAMKSLWQTLETHNILPLDRH
jgi:hypothetical protein